MNEPKTYPNHVGFKAPPDVFDALQHRQGNHSISITAKRDLERYYRLLEMEAQEFTEAEASLICDALNGTFFEPHTITLLWANIADAIRYDGLDGKWDVDGAALVERLRNLTPAQTFALADAAERFWNATGTTAERLRAVGLVRD